MLVMVHAAKNNRTRMPGGRASGSDGRVTSPRRLAQMRPCCDIGERRVAAGSTVAFDPDLSDRAPRRPGQRERVRRWHRLVSTAVLRSAAPRARRIDKALVGLPYYVRMCGSEAGRYLKRKAPE